MNTVISTMTKEDRRAFRKLITSKTYMVADKFTDNKMTSLRFYDEKMNEVERIYLESWPDHERLKEFSGLHDFDVRESIVFCPDHPRGERIITVYGEVNQERKEAKERQEALKEKRKKIAKQAYVMLRKYDSQLDVSQQDGLLTVEEKDKNLGVLVEYLGEMKKNKVDDLIIMNRMKTIILEIISAKKPKEIESLFEFAIRDCLAAYVTPGNAMMDEIIQKLPDTFLKEKVPFLEAHYKRLNEYHIPDHYSPEAIYITKVISDISGRVAK